MVHMDFFLAIAEITVCIAFHVWGQLPSAPCLIYMKKVIRQLYTSILTLIFCAFNSVEKSRVKMIKQM